MYKKIYEYKLFEFLSILDDWFSTIVFFCFFQRWLDPLKPVKKQIRGTFPVHTLNFHDEPQVPGSRPNGYCTLSTIVLTFYHHTSIIKLSVRWCVWKVGEGFADRVWPTTLKWVVVYSSVTFHIYGDHNERSTLCLFTVTGWGVMSCVCGMTFLSTCVAAHW